MFLGLDLGTTNVKAVVTDAEGAVRARGAAPVPLHHVGERGVEQDIDEIWAAVLAALAEAGGSCDLAGVRAVGVSAQGGALQLFDADLCPIGRVISWLDRRSASQNEELNRRLGPHWFARHIGHGRGGAAIGRILALRGLDAASDRKAVKIGFVGDAIVLRLCGRRAHDATSLSIALLYNPSLRRADPELLTHLGISEGQLPDLLAPYVAAGRLREDVARETGLTAGIPVSPAIHDQYAAALGSGAVRMGDVMFGAGTAWVLLATSGPGPDCTLPVIPGAFACTHVVDGLYGQMLSMVNGGSAFGWACRLTGLDDAPSEELDGMMESVPPGSDGLRCWPQLASPGAGLPGDMRGRLAGLRLSHGPAHLLRAVLEGLSLELARYLRFLTAAGIAVDRLVMCGGAAASRVTPQTVADATGLPVSCVTESAVSAHGAAVVARALAEGSGDLAALSTRMAPPVRLVEPGAAAPVYRRLLDEYIASLPKRPE